ncbi:hypothetical protein ABUV01_000749 [Serratia marcescens]
MTEVLTYEALKAERDALAVENAALKDAITTHSQSTHFCELCGKDDPCSTDDVCYALNETPATSAALAAIEAQGVEKFADRMLTLANDPTYSTASHRNDLRDAGAKAMNYAAELREAK